MMMRSKKINVDKWGEVKSTLYILSFAPKHQ